MSKGLKLTTLAIAGMGLFASAAANAEVNNFSNNLSVGGLFKLDVYKTYFNDVAFDSYFIKKAMDIRDAKVKFAANSGDWALAFGMKKDGANWSASDVNVDYVVTYSGLDQFDISFGRMCPVYGLEGSQSSSNGTFMEDSIAGQMFAVDRRNAVTLSGSMDNFGGGASVFVTEGALASNATAWKYGFSARGFYNSVQPSKAWSVGLSFYYEDATRDTAANTFSLSNTLVGFSTTAQKANNYASVGGVFAAGDKSAQTEIFYNVADTTVNKLSGSVQGAWVVTGEAREFDASTGTLGSVAASNNAYGAVEVALRADYLYISGAAKSEYAYTFGTNWYANSNVKLQANIVVASIDNAAIAGTNDDDKYVIGAGLRAQVSF